MELHYQKIVSNVWINNFGNTTNINYDLYYLEHIMCKGNPTITIDKSIVLFFPRDIFLLTRDNFRKKHPWHEK